MHITSPLAFPWLQSSPLAFPLASILTQTLPYPPPTNPPKLLTPRRPLLPPQPRRLHIRRTFIIRTIQQTQHTNEYRLRRLRRIPSLCRALISVLIITRRMKDGDAETSVRVDVWVEGNGCGEDEGGWEVGVLWGEEEGAVEVASWIGRLALGGVWWGGKGWDIPP